MYVLNAAAWKGYGVGGAGGFTHRNTHYKQAKKLLNVNQVK